jgi:hypothetical protein
MGTGILPARADGLECTPGTGCITAKKLQEYCSNSGKQPLMDGFANGFCYGYIEGIINGSNMFADDICFHGKMTIGEIPGFFLEFMRTTDSSLWTKGLGRADLAVFAAFGESFPCAEKPESR